jgi:hypothetical protein
MLNEREVSTLFERTYFEINMTRAAREHWRVETAVGFGHRETAVGFGHRETAVGFSHRETQF